MSVANDAGAPLLPPGGVMPPAPVKYGASEWRYPTSPQNVMNSLGMYWKLIVESHW